MMADSTSHVEPVGTQSSEDEAFKWRVEQYLAMEYGEGFAFNEAQARALAASTQSATTGGKDKNSKKATWSPPLNWQRVKKALDSGKCDPELAIQIFVTADDDVDR